MFLPRSELAYSAVFWVAVHRFESTNLSKNEETCTRRCDVGILDNTAQWNCEDGRVHGNTEGSDTDSAHHEITVKWFTL